MAGSDHRLNAQRAGLLLRVQRVREDRQRFLSRRADHDHALAIGAERAARLSMGAHEVDAARQLAVAHGSLRGTVIGLGALTILKELEDDLAREAMRQTERLLQAEAETREARASAEAATEALQSEARATARRTKLADVTAHRWRDLVETAEEVERDDQVADTWRTA